MNEQMTPEEAKEPKTYRRKLPILMIIIGLTLIAIGVYPLIQMQMSLSSSTDEWEQIRQEAVEPAPETPEEPKEEVDSTLIAMMEIADFGVKLPIREGTTDAILDTGIGLDGEASMLGAPGNSVLYGHREQMFWDLKDVQIGDKILVETLDSEYTYEVFEAKIVSPYDEFIYRESTDGVITLVTCYPFIYMGPITDRYVVKAKLVVE